MWVTYVYTFFYNWFAKTLLLFLALFLAKDCVSSYLSNTGLRKIFLKNNLI